MRWSLALWFLFLAAPAAQAERPVVLESHLAARSFLVTGWETAPEDQREALVSDLFAGVDDDSHWDPWIHIHTWDGKVAQFDGAVMALFVDPEGSPTDRDLLSRSNAPTRLDREAQVLEMPPVGYPEEARTTEIEGSAGVRCHVGADGRLELMLVVPHDGDGILVGAALGALRQARFAPAVAEGRAVASWIRVPFRFVLEGEVAVR